MTKATGLDAQIALNLKRIRAKAKLSQPQVAAHLGITYQSYQKMEGGKHSFRVSTLDKLSTLYNCPMSDFVSGHDVQLDPLIIKAQILMGKMGEEEKEACVRVILHVLHNSNREHSQ